MDAFTNYERLAREAAAKAEQERAKPKPPPLRPLAAITANELLATDLPPREMILAPWLPLKGLAMVYGPRGIGKTHLTLGIGYAAACGGSFLTWRAPTPRRVLVIDGEMPAVALQERLASIVRGSLNEPPSPDHLRILALDLQEQGLDLSDATDQETLGAIIGDAELIIVDNISTLCKGGKENEAESWTGVQAWALRMRREGRSVLFIHHAGKGGAQRGTSRREDVLDSVLSLRRPDDHEPDQGARFQVHYEKSRGFYGKDAEPFETALGPAGWTTKPLADAVADRIIGLSDEGLAVREIATETGISPSRVQRIQAKARADGKLLTTPKPGPRRRNSGDYDA
jgi:hypothetical protein